MTFELETERKTVGFVTKKNVVLTGMNMNYVWPTRYEQIGKSVLLFVEGLQSKLHTNNELNSR